MEDRYLSIIDAVCCDIKNGKIHYDGTLAGIVLTGSMALGCYHAKSDIDLHVIVHSVTNKIHRICKIYDDTIVQISIYSFSKFAFDCLHHDRKRPACYACKLLFDPDGLCMKLIGYSSCYLQKGPIKLTSAERAVMASTIKTEFFTAEGLAMEGNNAPAALIINETLQLAISYYNDSNNYWMANNNYLFTELATHDIELGKLANQIILSSDLTYKLELLKCFCKKCIADFDTLPLEYSYEASL